MRNDSKYIYGIKAIADFLNTSERNVYRWEKELELPLRRMAGASGRTVYASVKDLEKWLKLRTHTHLIRRRRIKRNITIICVLFVVIALVWIFSTRLPRSHVPHEVQSRWISELSHRSPPNLVDHTTPQRSFEVRTYPHPRQRITIFQHIEDDSLNRIADEHIV